MKYFIQYFQIGDISMPSGYSREFCSKNRETGNEKITNYREFSKPGSRFPNPCLLRSQGTSGKCTNLYSMAVWKQAATIPITRCDQSVAFSRHIQYTQYKYCDVSRNQHRTYRNTSTTFSDWHFPEWTRI